jgi:diguanylate cyclase (GGDEF)-like protein/PAS domain S-box-containing protein
MQNELLDLIIIGCLVLLFASTYRKRANPMVRSWTIGWVLILIHFSALLIHPTGDLSQKIVVSIALAALIGCGIVFLLAAGHRGGEGKPRIALPVLAGWSAMGFVLLDVFGASSRAPYLVLTLTGALCWLAYAVRVPRTSLAIRVLLAAGTLASTGWLFWTIRHARFDIGVSALLAELYLLVSVAYFGSFRRISGGTITVSFGLLAWAAVFPVGEFCIHLGIFSHISPEFWNVPKYFVAFGMMLVLLEEEIIAAKHASKHYRVLFEANPHPMWIYNRNTLAFEGVNDAAIAQYGYSREQFLSMTLKDIAAPVEREVARDEFRRLRIEDSESIEQHRKRDGSLCFVDVATHPLPGDRPDLSFSLVQDVTERQQLHMRLSHQATHDLLTGLANRALLESKLRDTISHSQRYHRMCALCCLDLDRFKAINDTYGHGAGDACLQEIARRLNQRVRSMDVAARIGGEEFSLLLHEIDSPQAAEHVASEILASLRVPIEANGYTLELTGSIGIAIYPRDGQDAATLWRNADAAMYRAKRAGGNQYLTMSPEIILITSEASEIEHDLRRALKGDGLELHYQPLFDIDGQLHSLEALVRFRHAERGLIYPSRFVSIAEDSGLIVPLGAWVLNEVCRQSAHWLAEGLPAVRVAINISPLQITRPDFAAQVLNLLEGHKISPSTLGMEITETAMMRNVAEAGRQIEMLAQAGIVFSIDDFGTGYSSLGQLDKLSVQSLKIDRTFIERLCRPHGTGSIVDAIISMAHSLGLDVIAEGVETDEQWSYLRDLKCDIVQGYLFSKPLPADEVPALIAHKRIQPGIPPKISKQVRVA